MSMRAWRRAIAVTSCVALGLVAVPPARSGAAGDDVRWSDVGRTHWAREAIDFVGARHDWMRDLGEVEEGVYPFEPNAPESRELFARALYRAFGAGLEPDPSITLDDLPEGDRFHRFANVAVAQRWMETSGASFEPHRAVTTREVHRALVLALGLGDAAAGADALHLRDGTPIPTPPGFGTLLIGMRLGLRYNHGDDARDVAPDTPLSRAEVAWSLYRAATASSWLLDSMDTYATMELPNLSRRMQAVVAWGARYVGYPYIWGGEWGDVTPAGYCCGAQPVGGFDCSGLVWWLMRRRSDGWDNSPPREYAGWSLLQRSSSDMASVGRVRWREIEPGDLLFYDGSGDGTVDHVNVAVGNGWAIDANSGNGGVSFTRIRNNWYEQSFIHGRRILS
jgi:hypothetical protein